MATATTLTPTPTSATTTEPPKLLKKASISDIKLPVIPTQQIVGCQHVKNLLQAARDKAVDCYARVVTAIRKDGNLSDRMHKKGDGAVATGECTYLCLQCPNVSNVRERHRKDHAFSVESSQGYIFCHDCKDFVYDSTFEEMRCSNKRKRKHSDLLDETDKRLVALNSANPPCAATGLRGLYNMGQTCFMSVILQSLVHNPLIRAYYLSEGHRSTDCRRETCISCALDEIFTDFYGHEKHEGYGAVLMLQGCWKGGGGLAGYSQQDAHEYLNFMLNSLHTANSDDDDSSSQKDARDCECIIHQTFGGLYKSTVTCSKCKTTSSTVDPFNDLSLDIKGSATREKKKKLPMTNATKTVIEVLPMDLTECLNRFTSPETLSSDSWHCRKCASAQEAKKKLSLSRLPPVIPIHLKRFSHSKTLAQSSKVETKIRFPFSLDLMPYTTSSSAKSKHKLPNGNSTTDDMEQEKSEEDETENLDPVYELASVVVHKGKIDNGHYISYSRQGDEWFRFDDSMVVQVDEKEVLGAEAYMLFYIAREFDVA